jgi:hypothetical protein
MLVLVCLEIVLTLMQDRYTVCVERTIGSEIVLDTPDVKVTRLKWMLVLVCLETVLILTKDGCTVCVERAIGSEIILDAPDGSSQGHWSLGILFQYI